MSLEQAIAQQTAAIMANTDAVNALLAALANGTAPIGAVAPGVTTQPVDVKPRKPKATTQPVEEVAQAEPQTTEASPSLFDKTADAKNIATEIVKAVAETIEDNARAAAPTRTLEEVQKLVLEKVVGNRDAVVAALKTFGAAKASQLKPEQYDDAYNALSKIGA